MFRMTDKTQVVASQAADEMLEVAELEASQLPPEWTARSYGQPLALKQAAQLRAAYVRTLLSRDPMHSLSWPEKLRPSR